MITLKQSAVYKALLACYNSNHPAIVLSSPGAGKSALMAQLAEDTQSLLVDLRLILCEPTDVGGFPVPRDYVDSEGQRKGGSYVEWADPDWYIGLDSDVRAILLLEELPQAMNATQNIASQIIYDRAVRGKKLGPNVRVFATGNFASDRAGSARLLTHVANRMAILYMAVDHEDLLAWGTRSGKIHWLVNGFLRFRPELAHKFDRDADQFPSPRSWEAWSKVLSADPSADIEYALCAGIVGEGTAAEFTGFAKIARSLPDLDYVIANPLKAPVPSDEVAALYAIASGLARKATKSNFGNVVTYLERLPLEFAVFSIRDCDDSLKKTKPFVDWAMKHSSILG